MAGLFYLPRLYVYHTGVSKGGDTDRLLQIMERKLLRVIMNPAMVLTLVFGMALASLPGVISGSGWFHVKALLLIALFGFHGFLAYSRKKFALGQNNKSEKFYRTINEVPAVLLVMIVVLAVVKPF